MRKWREIYSLHFLILSLFPPPLSISYIKICHILSQNVKYGIFVANVTKTEHTRYEEIILGRFRCEKAPQVVRGLLSVKIRKHKSVRHLYYKAKCQNNYSRPREWLNLSTVQGALS